MRCRGYYYYTVVEGIITILLSRVLLLYCCRGYYYYSVVEGIITMLLKRVLLLCFVEGIITILL